MTRKRRRNRPGRSIAERIRESRSSVPERIGPTPETQAKLEPDPLGDMVAAGLIDSAGERAAQEIFKVYQAVCGCVMRQSRPLGPYTPGVFDMPDEIAKAHVLRYLPWARATRRQTVVSVIDLVVDRRPPESSIVREAVTAALADYARQFDGQNGRDQKKNG